MQWWQEEHERVQADFMQCICSFQTMIMVWGELIKSKATPGANALLSISTS
jgi:hypothetical protein